MRSLRWTVLGVSVAAAALVMAERSVSADCSNGVTSEGYDQCQKYSTCQCNSETRGCPNGSWWTRYWPTEPCGSGSRPPGSSPPASKPRSPACDAMKDWLDERKKLLDAYRDKRLVDRATRHGWSSHDYHMAVWRRTHPGQKPPTGGVAAAANMYTDWRSCAIVKDNQGCDQLEKRGLPPESCAIALVHEDVHVNQCKTQQPKPTDPGTASRYEQDAYSAEIAEIEKWMRNHCP